MRETTETLNLMNEALRPILEGVCGWAVAFDTQQLNVERCGKTATTFCRDCGVELCTKRHAVHLHSETYCPGCADWHEKYDLTPKKDGLL
jgi:hypothetical protein